jgi:hypothetical protein
LLHKNLVMIYHLGRGEFSREDAVYAEIFSLRPLRLCVT